MSVCSVHGTSGPFVSPLVWCAPCRDSLLLETGFLAVLVAPLHLLKWRSTAWRPHDSITFWLMRWLLFRLMFASGVVKLTSRCPTWWGLTGEGPGVTARGWANTLVAAVTATALANTLLPSTVTFLLSGWASLRAWM